MLCDKCRKELPDDSLFCQYCGSSIQNQDALDTDCVKTEENAPVQEAFEKKPPQKKKRNFSWLWIVLIVFNCVVAFVSVGQSVHWVLDCIYSRILKNWRYLNIDSSYSLGYTGEEYLAAITASEKEIILSVIVLGVFLLLFVALSIVNSFICKRKLSIKRKKIKVLPWLCTLITIILLGTGIALFYVFDYDDTISYFHRQVEKEQAEIEKEQAEMALQKKATTMLNSTQEAMSPSEAWEYAQRYPEMAEGMLIKIRGYVKVDEIYNYNYLEEREENRYGGYDYTENQTVKFVYSPYKVVNPYMLDSDEVVVVGKISELQKSLSSDRYWRMTIEIYDWKILG